MERITPVSTQLADFKFDGGQTSATPKTITPTDVCKYIGASARDRNQYDELVQIVAAQRMAEQRGNSFSRSGCFQSEFIAGPFARPVRPRLSLHQRCYSRGYMRRLSFFFQILPMEGVEFSVLPAPIFLYVANLLSCFLCCVLCTLFVFVFSLVFYMIFYQVLYLCFIIIIIIIMATERG